MHPEWPMDSYESAWRLFRSLSDENNVTADHILSRTMWPKHLTNLRVVDFGCGDGRLMESIILASRQPINMVHLVDPYEEWLQQAKVRIDGLKVVDRLKASVARAEDVVRAATGEVDVALAVHVIYLLSPNDLKLLLSELASGVPLFIVMDQRGSVFSQLWEKTATKYWTRLMEGRQRIESLDRKLYSVVQTEFDTHLANPLALRKDIQESVLSLLCYSSFSGMSKDTQAWAMSILEDHTASGKVVCDCVCYEVRRN